MGKRNKTYEVKNLSKVNTTLYKNGDKFSTDKSIGVLHNGKIKTIGNIPPDLTDYVKRDEVQQMIPDVSEYVKADEVQAMIDEAISDLGGEEGE